MNSLLVRVLVLITILCPGYLLALQPFFDDDKATFHAPEEPELTDFDLDVLMLCGGWGAEVKAVDFEAMMNLDANKAVVERLRKALGNRIYERADNNAHFIHQLRRVWFEQKGFQHVFCGEPDYYDLGGFHYSARYWQAQDKGWAGYRKLHNNTDKRPVAQCRKFYLKEKIKPPVYSISLNYRDPNSGKERVKCLSGYHRQMHGEAILIAGTRAFKQANRRVGKNTKEACLYKSKQDDIIDHFSQLVIKQRAIRTFYPIADKRPYCHRNKKDYKACLCSNL